MAKIDINHTILTVKEQILSWLKLYLLRQEWP